MKHIVLTTTLAGICFISQVNCLASFVLLPDLSDAYDAARAVFIGEVIKIEKVSSAPTVYPVDRLYRVTFKVEYSWKGAGFQEFGAFEVVVLSEQAMGDEWFSWGSFSEGRKYLVYAQETAEKNLIVPFASRTAPLFKASEDLKELQRMSGPFYRLRAKSGVSVELSSNKVFAISRPLVGKKITHRRVRCKRL